MKHTIGLLLIAALFACDSPPSKTGRKIKEILVFEAQFDSGKEINRHLTEKKEYNRKEQLVSETRYEESGEIDYRNVYSYDSKGRKTKDVYFLADKCHSVSEFHYQKNDSIKVVVVYKPNRKLDFTIQPCYDKKGFNYLDISRGANQKLRFWDSYEQNKLGQLEKWTRFNPDSTVQSTVVYEYDKQGREIKNTCSGELGGTYAFKYNQKGLKIEETAINTDDKTFLWLEVFSYDESNRLIKIVEYNDPKHRPENPNKIFIYEYKFW